MTNREKVLARYPGACALYCEHCVGWHIYGTGDMANYESSVYEDAAWESAAKRIEQEQKK